MKTVILKNTTATVIELDDLGSGITLPASSSLEITNVVTDYELANCESILTRLASGSIVINDGVSDLSSAKGIQYTTQVSVIGGARDRNTDKLRVHQTSRQAGVKTSFYGAGDDDSSIMSIGRGDKLIFEHFIGDTSPVTKTASWNFIENLTYIHEASISWEGCKLDEFESGLIPKLTTVVAEAGNYNLANGCIVVPAVPGQGAYNLGPSVDLTSPYGGLVTCLPDENGVYPPGMWDADWNSTTKLFENITFNPTATGAYNIIADNVYGQSIMYIFTNTISLCGSGNHTFRTSDVDLLGQGWYWMGKFTTHICAGHADHDWIWSMWCTLHRTRV